MVSAPAIAGVRALPHFIDFVRASTVMWRGVEGDDAVLGRTLHDIGRFLAGAWALYLAATPGGLTQSRLAALLETARISGIGRARSLLVFLRFVGFIEPATADDGRTRLHRPTEALKRAFRERYRRELISNAILDPTARTVADHIDVDEVFDRIIIGVAQLSVQGLATRSPTQGPSLDAISQRFGGLSVVGHLVELGCAAEPYPPTQTIHFSMAGFARRCGLSRAQVRRVLRAGADSGFMDVPRDGEVRLTPLLFEHLEMLVACNFMIIQWAAAQAQSAAAAAGDAASQAYGT